MTPEKPRGARRTPRLLLGLAALIGMAFLSAASGEDKTQDMSPPDTWLPRRQATLRVLNKIDSSLQQITIGVGDTAEIGPLAITLSGCFVRPDDLPADATAHLTIRDTQHNTQLFNAWILKEEPAINMVEHPVYDVQLAGCA